MMTGQPQYSVEIKGWKSGAEVAAEDFKFSNPSNSKKVELNQMDEIDEVPNTLAMEGAK